jgi:hypothetical protein
MACHELRDLLARWSAEGSLLPGDNPRVENSSRAGSIVYRDNVPARLLDAFESLAVSASESMQHQAAVLRSVAGGFDDLPRHLQSRCEDMFMRILAGLGDHIPTRELEEALCIAENTLISAGSRQTAHAFGEARKLFPPERRRIELAWNPGPALTEQLS